MIPKILSRVSFLVGISLNTIILLSGCSRDGMAPICPQIVSYTPQEQKTVSKELKSASLPVTTRFLEDYEGLREQVRACKMP